MVCSTCRIEKDISFFELRADTKRYRRQCQDCRKIYRDRWVQNNPEAIKTIKSRWRQSNRGQIRNYAFGYRITLHGISIEEKKNLWITQAGKCQICLKHLDFIKSLIDHDHGCIRTSFHRRWKNMEFGCRLCIRGLLCDNCNRRHLPFLEKHNHLQSDHVAKYLQQRPFAVTFYPDKRNRYVGQAPWSLPNASPHGDNPVQHPEPLTTIASRSLAPRDAFRVSTTEDPAVLQAQGEAEALKARQDAETQKGISSGNTDLSVPVGSMNVVYREDIFNLNKSKTSGEYQEVGSIDDVMGSEG